MSKSSRPRAAPIDPPVTGSGITTDRRCSAVCTRMCQWRRSQSSVCVTSAHLGRQRRASARDQHDVAPAPLTVRWRYQACARPPSPDAPNPPAGRRRPDRTPSGPARSRLPRSRRFDAARGARAHVGIGLETASVIFHPPGFRSVSVFEFSARGWSSARPRPAVRDRPGLRTRSAPRGCAARCRAAANGISIPSSRSVRAISWFTSDFTFRIQFTSRRIARISKFSANRAEPLEQDARLGVQQARWGAPSRSSRRIASTLRVSVP
jgi:hypothetical protein